jgi:hypothetical protein
MDYCDNFHAREENDYDNVKENELLMNEVRKLDRGYNSIWRKRVRLDGTIKRSKIEVYTSNGIGSKIRDAETGEYYNCKVGSLDEDLFFKVALTTGEFKSSNGSSTLFFLSPKNYMSHMVCELDQSFITKYELKREARLREIEKNNEIKTKYLSKIVIH